MRLTLDIPDDILDDVKHKLASQPTGVLEALAGDAVLGFLTSLRDHDGRSQAKRGREKVAPGSVSKSDGKIEKYQALGLGSLPVTALSIQQTVPQVGGAHQSLCLQLLAAGDHTVILTFSGLRQLRFGELHPGSVCSLNISSITDAQMEGLRYRVSNREQDFTLQFYCTDFETSVN